MVLEKPILVLVENTLGLLKDKKSYVPFIEKIKHESKRTKWDIGDRGFIVLVTLTWLILRLL